MNLFAITGLFVAIPSVALGIFTFSRYKKRIHLIWGFFSFSVALWGFGMYRIAIATNTAQSLFWWRIAEIGVIFIPVLLTHFVSEFLNLNKKWFIYFLYVITIIFLFFDIFTNHFVYRLRFVFNEFYYISPPTILYTLFILMFLTLTIYNIIRLWQAYKIKKGMAKSQLKYLIVAFFIGFSGGITSFLPVYHIDIYPVFNIAIFLSALIVAYTIFKYRLMDIRVVIKRGAIFSALVVAVTAAYVLFAFLIGWTIFGGRYTLKSQMVTGLVVAIATAIGFQPLYDWLRQRTDKYLFKGTYNPQELLADISDFLSRTLDLDKIIRKLKNEIVCALRISKMTVLIISERDRKILQDGIKNNIKVQDLTALNKILDHLRKNKEVLILEELKRKYADKVEFDKSFLLIKEIEQIKTDLIVPLYIKNRLIGLFLIGAKKSGDMFTVEDIRTLETIAAQAAIALENARLYEEMRDFSKTLQIEVDRQTKDLRNANEKLKQLDKAKSEFISLASHQLRTPLTAIKGYISMFLEGSWGRFNKEQEKNLKRIFVSNERLINLVEDLLMVSRIESGRLEFDFQNISLDRMAQGMVEEFSKIAQDKSLYLKYEKPAEELPMVKADSLKIRQVVQNLIENAIHYTEKGGVTVRIKSDKNKVIFSVTDTGIGISEEDRELIFEKFARGKGAAKTYTEGTGLGLYICAKLVKAHQGRIWLESEGKGKGTTFYFELPAEKSIKKQDKSK